MSRNKGKLTSIQRASPHVVGHKQTAILEHGPGGASIRFGKFMLDKPRDAAPRPEQKKPKK